MVIETEQLAVNQLAAAELDLRNEMKKAATDCIAEPAEGEDDPAKKVRQAQVLQKLYANVQSTRRTLRKVVLATLSAAFEGRLEAAVEDAEASVLGIDAVKAELLALFGDGMHRKTTNAVDQMCKEVAADLRTLRLNHEAARTLVTIDADYLIDEGASSVNLDDVPPNPDTDTNPLE